MTPRDRVSPWPLVARDDELAAFTAAWSSRRCQGVMIYGPGGVGKSRLAQECSHRAAEAGFTIGRATATQAAAAVPLGAIAHLIPPGVDLADPVRGFAEVAHVLAGPRRDRRRALLIDDLHWLDTTSVVLLRQLIDAGVVRLIGTVRTGGRTGSAVDDTCGGDAVHRIDLAEFSPHQLEIVLRAALGGPVGRRTLRTLHTASGGNALYLRELVLGALDAGTLTHDGELWELAGGRAISTPRLVELIGARLAAAPKHAHAVLELLALCGPVALRDAQTLTDLPTLTSLEEHSLVQATTDRRRSTITLAHPLHAEVLRAGIPPLRRRMVLLAHIERTRANGARRGHDKRQIAAWQLAATGTADPALLIEAAALARYAHDYRQATTLLQALPDEHHTTATRLLLGDVLFELGDPEHAETVLADAAESAITEQDKLAITFARTFNLFWALARTEDALAVNDAARAGVTSTVGLRMLRHNEGSMRVPEGDPRGLALLADLESDIHDAVAPVAWLTGAMMKPVGLVTAGRTVDAVASARHAYDSHVEVDHRTLYPHPAAQLVSVVGALAHAGRLGEARAVGERGHAELTAAHVPVTAMWMAVLLGHVEWYAGHPVSGRRWFAEAIALARKYRHVRPLQPALSGLAVCAALLGDHRAAGLALAEAREYPSTGIYESNNAHASAWIHARRGDLAQARRELLDAAGHARATGRVGYEGLLLTDVARLGGAADAATRLAELAEVCDGAMASARARLADALACDDPDLLLAVATELDAMGTDLLAAEAASAAATSYQRGGQSRKAARAAHQAHALAARCEGARTPLLAAPTTVALTPRQRDIALLAAAGTASQDIAASLHLSVRTVENHLQNAYRRLGVTTRAELANTLSPGSGTYVSTTYSRCLDG